MEISFISQNNSDNSLRYFYSDSNRKFTEIGRKLLDNFQALAPKEKIKQMLIKEKDFWYWMDNNKSGSYFEKLVEIKVTGKINNYLYSFPRIFQSIENIHDYEIPENEIGIEGAYDVNFPIFDLKTFRKFLINFFKINGITENILAEFTNIANEYKENTFDYAGFIESEYFDDEINMDSEQKEYLINQIEFAFMRKDVQVKIDAIGEIDFLTNFCVTEPIINVEDNDDANYIFTDKYDFGDYLNKV